MAFTALRPHFHVGKKEVFLPDFVVALLRTPNLPATSARFEVPLTFNKLDIRDYLFHAYGVRVLRVRSFVEQQAVYRNERSQLKRPMAKKFMTVEMDKPFVWPEEPKDFSPWDKEMFDAAQRTQAAYTEAGMRKRERNRDRRPFTEKENIEKKAEIRSSIAAHAKALLAGKRKFKPSGQAFKKM